MPRRSRVTPRLRTFSREMRREAPVPERLLWRALRDRQIDGLKFRRQHPVGPYIVDFFCRSAGLVVELDGDSHMGRAEYDVARENYLVRAGLRVLRVGNDDVLQGLEGVCDAIALAARGEWPVTAEPDRMIPATPSPQPSPPRTGEREHEP